MYTEIINFFFPICNWPTNPTGVAHETKMLLPTIFDGRSKCVDTEMYIHVRSRNNDGVKTGMFGNFYIGVN